MKVLYLTDNRSDYGMGYYYEDWLDAFKFKFPRLTVFGPGYDTKIEEIPESIDLVVYGHAFMDVYLQKKLRVFGYKSFKGLNLEKYKGVPSVLFSKNEYKLMDERLEFMSGLKSCLLVCYCRQTLEKYKDNYEDIIWAPFGVNSNRFRNLDIPREIDIGMRGNRHGSYIGQLREGVAEKLSKVRSPSLDVLLSDNGEDFLFGEEYVKWLNQCRFVGNTKSAMDIVNPKFAETLACGSIPVCPRDTYENILQCDKHYIDYNDLASLKSALDLKSYYNDKQNSMAAEINELVQLLDYSNMLEQIIKKVRGGHHSKYVFEQFK